MSAKQKKITSTGFRIEEEQLRQFRSKLAAAGNDMSPVIVGWIAEYVEGKRKVGDSQIPTAGLCPLCESMLKVTPKGLIMLKPGPLEPMAPGEIPAEESGLVRRFLALYHRDENFATVVNSLLTVYTEAGQKK